MDEREQTWTEPTAEPTAERPAPAVPSCTVVGAPVPSSVTMGRRRASE